MPNQHTPWTDAEIAQLGKLVKQGYTGREIGAKMGRTKCAIVSKCNRVGFKLHFGQNKIYNKRPGHKPKATPVHLWDMSSRTANGEAKRNRLKNARLRSGITDRAVDETLALTRQQCRYPIGDPNAPDFEICKANHRPSSPYCEFHHSVAYYVDENR